MSVIGWFDGIFRGPRYTLAFGLDPYGDQRRYNPKHTWTGIPALDDQFAEGIRPGESLLIIGPAGSGKTALLETIRDQMRGPNPLEVEELGENASFMGLTARERGVAFSSRRGSLVEHQKVGLYTFPTSVPGIGEHNPNPCLWSADFVLSLNFQNQVCKTLKNRHGKMKVFDMEFYRKPNGANRVWLKERPDQV
jgi:energy-coupling factor transporter ATP-binding protein EcfA2